MKKLRAYSASGQHYVEGMVVSAHRYAEALRYNAEVESMQTITLTAKQAEVLGTVLDLWHDSLSDDDHITLAAVKDLLTKPA